MQINWDKNRIFASSEEWNKAKLKLIENVNLLEKMLNTFSDSIETFKEFTHLKILIDKSIEEIYCYPRRYIDIDITDDAHNEMFKEALNIYKRIVAITNKFEILIRDNRLKIEEYLKNDVLSYYQRYYEVVFNHLDHINENEDESFKNYQSIRDEYQNLIANDLKYRTVKIDSDDVLIDEVNYYKYIDHDNQQVRRLVYETFIKAFQEKQDKIFSLYIKKLRNDIANAKAKKYDSLKQMKLLENELPDDLIDKTIFMVNKHLSIIHDYVSLKRELSGLDEYHSYDAGYKKFNCEVSDIDYQDAFKLVRDSLNILGNDYIGYVDSLYNDGSIDLLPKKGKRNISCTSITYAGIPYVCLNYKGRIDDVRTIAHEIGHAVHLLFSKKNNNFEYFEFSLFTTEVVAKVNERLFYHHYLEICDNIQDKLAVLGSYISSLGNSLFSQIMFTEFEDKIINKLSNNEEVHLEDVNKLYEDLLVKYNGLDFTISDYDKYGWLRVNHYLLQEPYYLYQYSIGTSLANIIYMRLISDETFLDKYKQFLSIGNKLSIIDSLSILDINLDNEEIFASSMELLKNLIKEYRDLSKKA